MSDIVQDILSVAAHAKPWEWEPDHPQYIEGRLWLTPEQWDTLCEAAPDYDREKWAARPALAWGIPVEIIQPDEPVTLPSGKTLLYSSVLGALLVSDPPPWVKYDPAGPGVTQVGRTRL